MSIDSSKLHAFANPKGPKPIHGDMPDSNEDLDNEKLAEDEDEDENEDENEDEDENENEDEETHDIVKLSELTPLLEEYLEDVEACCDEMDIDSLDDVSAPLSEDEEKILKNGVSALPPKLQKALGIALDKKLTIKHADYYVESELDVDEPALLAGWLVRVSELLSE